ncbi:DUF3908 family protein [Clostridium perfringens]|uniref:DUF3908 family protein n=1 Tax=Clostridium perfringens TaxID=1502 RepID=UPI003D2F6D52
MKNKRNSIRVLFIFQNKRIGEVVIWLEQEVRIEIKHLRYNGNNKDIKLIVL